MLDIRTVLVSSVITSAICAMVVASLWRQNRRRSPELGYWLADFVLQFLSILLIALRGVLPDVVSVLFGVPFSLIGALLMFIGLEHYVGKTSARRYNFSLLAGFILAHAYFVYGQPNLAARNINLSVGLLVVCGQCAWLLLRRVDVNVRRETKAVGVIFGIYGLISLLRIFADLLTPHSNDLFTSGLYDTLAILIYQMLLIGLTFALFLMVNRRLFMALENDIAERRQAAEALRQSEDKFSRAFQTAPYAITITRAEDGTFIEVNDTFTLITGFSRAEALADTSIGLKLWVNAEDRQSVVAALRASQAVMSQEYAFRKKGGEFITGLFSAQVIQLSQGLCILSSINDISERKQTEEALRENEERFRSLYENSTVGIYRTTPAGRILLANPALIAMLGYLSIDDLASRDLEQNGFEPAYNRAQFVETIERDGQINGLESGWTRRDGTAIFVRESARAIRDPQGRTLYYDGTVEDITDRKRAEDRVRQLNRVYAVLSDVNQAIVRVRDSQALFEATCRIAVEKGGFRLAWIGQLDEASQQVRVAAHAGANDDGYLEQLDIVVNEKQPRGRGPTAEALRTGQHAVVNDVEHDPRMALWREAALRRGYRSSAAFPLKINGETRGTVNLYAGEPGFFDEDELKLLDELAMDLSFSMEFAAKEVERRQAEETVNSLAKFPAENPNPILRIDREGVLLYANEASAAVLSDWQFVVGQPAPPVLQQMAFEALAARQTTTTDLEQGQRVISFVATPVLEADYVNLYGRDVTERVRAEEALRESEARYRHTLDAMLEGCQILGFDWRYLYLNDVADIHNRRPKAELLGQKYMDMWPGIESTEVFRVIRSCMEERVSQSMENEFVFPDGSEGWFELRIYPVPEGCVILSIDITERKQAEQALRESEERYRTVADYTYSWEYWRASDGNIVYTSPSGERISGYRVAEFLENPGLLDQIVHPEDHFLFEQHQSLAHQAPGESGVHEAEFRILRKDGELRWIGHTCQAIYRADGTSLGRRGTNHDITERKQAEEKLRVSEAKFKAVFDNAPIGISLLDPDRRLQESNDMLAQIVRINKEGLAAGAYRNRKYIREDGSEIPTSELASTRAIAEQKTIRKVVNGIVLEDDEVIWTQVSAAPLGLPDSRIVVITEDITARKQAEEALRESEERFRRAVVGAPFPIMIHAENGEVVVINTPWTKLTGYDHADIPTIADWTQKAYGVRMELVQADIDQLYALDGPKTEGEYTIRTHSGQARIWDFGSAPIGRLPDGRRLVISMAMDVTERKRAEAEIQKLNAELEQRVIERTAELSDLYNNAPCGYHSLDSHGVFVLINDTELRWLGYTREEVIGKMRATDLFTPASVETFNQNFPVFKARGWLQDLELEMVRKDGSLLPILLNATVIADKDGQYLMSRSTMTDHTDRKRAESQRAAALEAMQEAQAQLEAANKELEAFAYSVSHDVRAPLRAIDGFSRILLEDYADRFDAEGQRLFGVVRANAQKMDQLIIDLLALSRITRNEMVLSRLDMTTLVQAVYADIVLPEVQAQFTFTVATLPEADGDATLLRQVWNNLLANAIKYTLPQPVRRIEVGGYRQGDEYIYFVKDTGVGFNPAYTHKLFGVFQRLHKAEEFEGIGVGLAIVQRIIQRHGGRVWAEGQIDSGATFYFTLPCTEAGHEPSI
ncbi:MAG: PAS domain S-box protein [Chloroflexi bacterium]|nr:PAS domain S-box protein [Chloroflexota bacterium]